MDYLAGEHSGVLPVDLHGSDLGSFLKHSPTYNDSGITDAQLNALIAKANAQSGHHKITEMTYSGGDTSDYHSEPLDMTPWGDERYETLTDYSPVNTIPSVTIVGKREFPFVLPSYTQTIILNDEWNLTMPYTPCGDGVPGNKVDQSFLSNHEGGQHTTSYVPSKIGSDGIKHAIGQSGLTIATGVDLGGQSAAAWASMGISQTIIDKFSNVNAFGTKGDAALSLPTVTITTAEANEIDSHIHAYNLAHVQVQFDNAVGKAGAFWSLPTEVQTAMADLALQLWSIPTKDSQLWDALTHYKWNTAADLLWSKDDGFLTRRRDESILLRQAASTHQDGTPC